jgi:hypothetical protein
MTLNRLLTIDTNHAPAAGVKLKDQAPSLRPSRIPPTLPALLTWNSISIMSPGEAVGGHRTITCWPSSITGKCDPGRVPGGMRTCARICGGHRGGARES